MEAYSDRSRLLEYQRCPRARYFGYEIPTKGMRAWDGETFATVNGIVSTRIDLDLLVGTCFHRGCEYILRGAKDCQDWNGFKPSVDAAVEAAVEGEFWPIIKSRGGILGETEDAAYVYHEHAALIEALIRGWEKFSLPQLLERFTVVEVEEEYLGKFEVPGFTLNFGARIDALLMEKDTLDLYVLSLKTTKEWGKKSDDEARHDMQGLSETEVVDQKLKRWHQILSCFDLEGLKTVPDWFIERFKAGAAPQVSGVKMEFALKGRKSEYPEGSGRYSYSNPLIRPWKKDDGLGMPQYAFKFETQDEYGHKHRLGKGWNRINIWEDIGVKAWIEMLATESIQGFDPMRAIQGQFVLPFEYQRNDGDIKKMKRMVAYQEKRISEGRREVIRPLGWEGLQDKLLVHEHMLDEHFPMHSKNCDWPKKCIYQDICYGPEAYIHDPLASQIYQIRVPNHKIEEALLTGTKT